jgi:hypothetical protein
MPMLERRSHRRIPCALRAATGSGLRGRFPEHARVQDIGPGGVQLTGIEAALGDLVEFEIEIPGEDTLQAVGRVVRSGEGLGVRFVRIAYPDSARLERLVGGWRPPSSTPVCRIPLQRVRAAYV